MPLFSFEGRSPQVRPAAFVAPTASTRCGVTGNGEEYQRLARRHAAGIEQIG